MSVQYEWIQHEKREVLMEAPEFCDRFCPHAEFPRKDALDGACRREVTLWCNRFSQLVRKNDRCIALKKSGSPSR